MPADVKTISVMPKEHFNHLRYYILLTLLTVISSGNSHSTYNIFPTCLGGDAECLTLSNAAKQPNKYFTTNTTLNFSPGDHSLRGELVSIASLSGLTIIGSSGSNESNPRILCDDSSFSFSNVSDVHILSISFVSCSLDFSSAAAKVHFCWFDNSTADSGGALAVNSGSNVHLSGESRFVGNRASRGGAVFVDSSNLTFSGQCEFIDNIADHSGGAVYIGRHSLVTFRGSSTFVNNSAEDGGAVLSQSLNALNFDGTSVFYNNTASYFGGAVFAAINNGMTFKGSSSFHGNTAWRDGGAIHAQRSNTVRFSGTTTLRDNRAWHGGGGAVFAWHSNTVSFNGTSTFHDNTALDGYGGAVCVIESNAMSFNGNSTFHNNAALHGSGGAVCVFGTNTMNFSGTITFRDNAARNGNGGAVFVIDSNIMSFSGTSAFHDNVAQKGEGGAVFVFGHNTMSFSGTNTFHDNAVWNGNGGAVHVVDSNTVSFSGTSTFHDNAAWNGDGGAVCALYSNTVSFSETSIFYDNAAWDGNGGAVWVLDSNVVSLTGTTTFHNNSAWKGDGGAVCAFDSNAVSFSETTTFHDNAAWNGGAVCAYNRNAMSFSGTSAFDNNTSWHGSGGAVCIFDSNTVNSSGSSAFHGNMALYDGGAMSVFDNNTVSFSVTSSFRDNMASDNGGVLYVYDNNIVTFSGTNTFLHNKASADGGALYAYDRNIVVFTGNSSFIGNMVKNFGGGISSITRNRLSFSGISKLLENKAFFGGGIHAGHNSTVNVSGITEISQNQATYGGGIFVQGGDIVMNVASATFSTNLALQHRLIRSENATFNGTVVFSRNSDSERGFGGAIHAVSSRLSLKGRYLVTGNKANFGGGLAISGLENRVLLLNPGTRLAFVGNTAYGRGGGIHIEDNPFTYCILQHSAKANVRETCFFQVYEEQCSFQLQINNFGNSYATENVSLTFTNNTAIESGGTLYGGNIENCGVCQTNNANSYFPGRHVFEHFTSEQDISELEIASDPLKVCVCDGSIPNCYSSNRSIGCSAYPGETLPVNVVAVGQMDGIVPSVIRAVSEELHITPEYATQPTDDNKNCTELHYPLLTTSVGKTVTLELYSDEPCSTSGYPLTVSIIVLPCPTGFSLSNQGECSCEDRLRTYTRECNITDQTITREKGSSFWVGVDYQENISSGLILHPHCPFDYCTDEALVFSLKKPDAQCHNGRSGVLCGGCRSGYSLALGSSRCMSDCSNVFLAQVLVFIAAGLALVTFLFICNLTVAKGTISGLIFYANILAINQSVYLNNLPINFLTVFVAWLNLDLGIETCFFSGLDIYSRTWLQFAFPFYIWVMVGLIVYLADISTTVAKLLTHTNPVAVLATLFLLSYTKLLRTIMAAFSFTTLSYPEGETMVVWLYDGNIGYWDSKHLVLLLFSLLVFCILYIPYTAFLVCGQLVQRKLKLRCISPAKQLYIKYFCDAYYAPFRNRHCYWTGLLLLVRFFLLLLSTIINIGSARDPHTNLLVVVVVVSGLLALIGHGVYRKWYNNVLEASFLFNLIILSVGTYQVRLSAGNQAALVYTSISVAFITFSAIVVCAVMQFLRKTRFGKSISHRINKLCHPKEGADDLDDPQDESCQASVVTTSTVMIAQSQSSDSANYRETVLDLA